MLPVVSFSVPNAQRITLAFAGMAKDLKDWRPVWRYLIRTGIKPWLFGNHSFGKGDWTEGQFESEGKIGAHGAWAPLTPAYAEAKYKKWGNQPILIASGRLYQSLFYAEGQLQPLSMTFGTDVPYALFHQTGYRSRSGRMVPARRIFDPDARFNTMVRRQSTRAIVTIARRYGFSIASSLGLENISAAEALAIGRAHL